MELEYFNPPEGSVILIKESSLDPESEEIFLSALMQKFEGSLIVILSEGMTLESLTFEELEQVLVDLIRHKEATAGGNPSD